MDGTPKLDRVLGVAAWAVMAGGLLVDLFVRGAAAEPNRGVLFTTLVVFFLVLCVRLVLALRRRTRRRSALRLLLVGLIVWAAESAFVAGATVPASGRHLSAGELLFLVAYLAFVLYLLMDTEHRAGHAVSTWLEVAVLCGGSASVASVLLLTPLANRFGGGAPLLIALLYPVTDLVLALLVIGQVALRVRSRSRLTGALALGFLAMAAADTTFVGNVTLGNVGTTRLTALLWGAGFALIIGAACRLRPDAPLPASRAVPGPVLMCAAVAAVVVLAVHPGGAIAPYVVIPGAVTLLAAGGRLVLALREARDAAEAFALARTDDLTLLPNRRAVLARVDEHIAANRPLSLVLMDLNGFKEINDALGHLTGDRVLAICARRMREALPQSIQVARFGGDEFALTVSDDDPIAVLEIAQRARAALSQPTYVEGLELVVDAAAGVAVREPSDKESVALMRRADVAMYQAKTSGAGALLYDPAHDEHSRAKLQLAEELRHGIASGQVVLWYQPQVHASTLEVYGLEALVRWQHPVQGIIPPLAFLPLARQTGLMAAVSETVAARAVADLRRWQADGMNVRVSLNCAAPELLSGVFSRRLEREAMDGAVELSSFTIEVTEDSFLADPERTRATLHKLRQLGLGISIDDYGTGFSSLAYLRDLPLDELKLDRSFISAMVSDRRSRMIVESTLHMAHALELRVVGEGVENGATSAALVAMGADVLQGYHLARPMPPEAVPDWIAARESSLWLAD